MPRTVTTDTSTDIGRVRLLLRDQNPEKAAFDDAELQVFLDLGGSVESAVGYAARALLMERARFATTFGDNQNDDSALIEYLRGLVEMYGGRAPAMPYVTVSSFAAHPSDPQVL